MPTFTFMATDQDGKSVSGVRTAATRQELTSRLRADKLVATSVKENATPGQAKTTSGFMDTFLLGSVKTADLMILTRQLAAMLKAGISLMDALHTVAHGSSNLRLRKILIEVRSDVQRGRTLTDAMRKHPATFNQLFISLIHAGETGGGLARSVARLSEYLKRKEGFRRKMKSATAYPKFVIGFFIVLTSVIFLLIIPRFKTIFEQFNAKLPPLTQFFMDFSILLRDNIIFIGLAVGVLVVGFVFLRRSPGGSEWMSKVVIRIPFFGDLFLKGAVARLSLTLSTLLENGIPLTDALQIAIPTLDNAFLETGLKAARRDVVTGHSLAESLARMPALPRLLPRMVRVGEESGTMSGMLEDVAEYYDQEVDASLSKITALVEPVLICGMGGVVLVTVIAIYLPIFSLGGAMRGG